MTNETCEYPDCVDPAVVLQVDVPCHLHRVVKPPHAEDAERRHRYCGHHARTSIDKMREKYRFWTACQVRRSADDLEALLDRYLSDDPTMADDAPLMRKLEQLNGVAVEAMRFMSWSRSQPIPIWTLVEERSSGRLAMVYPTPDGKPFSPSASLVCWWDTDEFGLAPNAGLRQVSEGEAS